MRRLTRVCSYPYLSYSLALMFMYCWYYTQNVHILYNYYARCFSSCLFKHIHTDHMYILSSWKESQKYMQNRTRHTNPLNGLLKNIIKQRPCKGVPEKCNFTEGNDMTKWQKIRSLSYDRSWHPADVVFFCSRQQTREKLLSHPFIYARIFSSPHLEATAGLPMKIIYKRCVLVRLLHCPTRLPLTAADTGQRKQLVNTCVYYELEFITCKSRFRWRQSNNTATVARFQYFPAGQTIQSINYIWLGKPQ